jgi:transposase
MEIPKHLLQSFIESVKNIILSYNRKYVKEKLTKKPKEEIEQIVRSLYSEEKKIEWLNNSVDVKNKLNLTDKPWVHHYSLNMSWILFYKSLYEMVFNKNINQPSKELENFIQEGHETYHKVYKLYVILNTVDGIMESDDTIYLVKTDISFIRPNIKKIFI